MSRLIEITDFHAPELDIYARLTEAQLRSSHGIENSLFIAESPHVIQRALDAGCVPESLLMLPKMLDGRERGQEILARCGEVPVYVAEEDCLKQLTGFPLTRGVLCAMRRPPLPGAEACTPTENAKMRHCLQDNAKNAFLDDAQAFIAVYKDENVTLNKGTEKRFPSSHFIEYDVGEFMAYITLAAKDKGIDSCIIGWVNGDKLNETFSLSGKCDIVVALGYAKEDNIRTKNRKSLRDVIINYEEKE